MSALTERSPSVFDRRLDVSRHGFELVTMDKNYAFDVFTLEALEAWTSAIQRVCACLLKKNISKGFTDTSESVPLSFLWPVPRGLMALTVRVRLQDSSLSDSKSTLAVLHLRKEGSNMLCADCNSRGTPTAARVVVIRISSC